MAKVTSFPPLTRVHTCRAWFRAFSSAAVSRACLSTSLYKCLASSSCTIRSSYVCDRCCAGYMDNNVILTVGYLNLPLFWGFFLPKMRYFDKNITPHRQFHAHSAVWCGDWLPRVICTLRISVYYRKLCVWGQYRTGIQLAAHAHIDTGREHVLCLEGVCAVKGEVPWIVGAEELWPITLCCFPAAPNY